MHTSTSDTIYAQFAKNVAEFASNKHICYDFKEIFHQNGQRRGDVVAIFSLGLGLALALTQIIVLSGS